MGMSIRERIKRRTEQEATATAGGGKPSYFKGDVNLIKVKDTLTEQNGSFYSVFDFLNYVVTEDENSEGFRKGEEWFRKEFFVHKNVGPYDKTVVCPSTFGLPCPICERVYELGKDYDSNKDIYTRLKKKKRQLYNVIDLNSEDKQIAVLDMSAYLFGDLLRKEYEEDDFSNACFPDTKAGKTIRVRWETKSYNDNPFYSADKIVFKDRKEYPDDITSKTYDLDNILVQTSYNDILKMMGSPVPVEQKEEEVAPKTTQVPPKQEELPPVDVPEELKPTPQPVAEDKDDDDVDNWDSW
jgi:hypothetical protein